MNVGQDVHSLAVGPSQLAHPALQVWQILLESAYMPSPHDATHVVPFLLGVLEAHATQSLEPPPEHVLQLESHAWQVLEESTYVPAGHASMHELVWKIGVLDVSSHEVQVVALPAQVRHSELHSEHVEPDTRNCPSGQTNVHVLAEPSNVAPVRQLAQSVAVPPVHVLQVESQD